MYTPLSGTGAASAGADDDGAGCNAVAVEDAVDADVKRFCSWAETEAKAPESNSERGTSKGRDSKGPAVDSDGGFGTVLVGGN